MTDPVIISTSSGDQKVYTDACLKKDLQHIKDQLKEAISKDDAEVASALKSLGNCPLPWKAYDREKRWLILRISKPKRATL